MRRSDKNNQSRTLKRPRAEAGLDLRTKVARAGGPMGYSLEQSQPTQEDGAASERSTGIYGQRVAASCDATTSVLRRRLLFPNTAHSKAASRASGRSCFSRQTSTARTVSRPAVHVVCAISENMARETCVASLDAGSPTTMQVTKQGNGQTYAETLSYLELLQPDEVLLNEGRKNSQLVRKILEMYQQSSLGYTQESDKGQGEELRTSTVVKFISRASFDQTRGSEILRRIARPETYDASVIEEYILLSSAHALVNYTQQSLGANFAPRSLFLSVNSGGNNRMAIDRATLLQLELLVNSKTGKTKHSLIGTIDKTRTVVGGRLLRTNLMMPPTNVDTINARLDLVDLFLSNEDFFYSVLEHLSRLPDVDRMLSNVALIPKSKKKGDEDEPINVRMAAKGISALVGIKSSLSAMPALSSVLQAQLVSLPRERSQNHGDEERTTRTDRSSLLVGLGGSAQSPSAKRLQANHLLKAIIFTLNQPELKEVLDAVSDVFTPSTEFSRNANAMKHQECFALKADEGGIMSLLRKNYLANVDDIYKKADEYAEIYGYNVVVKYTTLRGYFLAIPSDAGKDLPTIFIQPSLSGRYIHCTTEAITSLNTRAKDNVRDLLIMTHSCIQDVLEFARERYDAIAALCDAIALLDMCHSFADTVSLSNQLWSRPLVVDPEISPKETNQNDTSSVLSTALVIRKGRFGIEVPYSGHGQAGDFVANDAFAGANTRLTLVTGINGSGKSTYLKQLAIIVVLAHCGSYVPAEQASIPLRDRLCTRIGNADDQENNISTFMLEMKEMAFICNNITPKSLVLIDELGRATSNEDGVALAWSVVEYILKKKAMTYFVTHYPKLTELAELYQSVQNIHLGATLSPDTREIKYTHRIEQGACSVPTDYGVSLAGACGWPDDTVAVARKLELEARAQLAGGSRSGIIDAEIKHSQMRAQQNLDNVLKSLQDFIEVENASSFHHLRRELGSLRDDMAPADDPELARTIFTALLPSEMGPWDDSVKPTLDDTSSISSTSSAGSSTGSDGSSSSDDS